jgi:hypothetical protein
MTTVSPIAPAAGAILAIDGATRNVAPLVAVPPAVVTDIVPDTAPEGTVAVICVSLFTVMVTTGVAPIVTAVAPVNPLPAITTVDPTIPEPGANPVMDGTGTTV